MISDWQGDERRAVTRYPLRLPVTLKIGTDIVRATTINVSASGVCLSLLNPPPLGAKLECTMIFPPDLTLAGPVHTRCTGRVVRVEQYGMLSIVAITIRRYEFLPGLAEEAL
jgi:hypothetical protein